MAYSDAQIDQMLKNIHEGKYQPVPLNADYQDISRLLVKAISEDRSPNKKKSPKEIIKLLKSHPHFPNTDINYPRDKDGNTLLHIATQKLDLETVNFLFDEFGKDDQNILKATNAAGLTAIDLALQNKPDFVTGFLETAVTNDVNPKEIIIEYVLQSAKNLQLDTEEWNNKQSHGGRRTYQIKIRNISK